MINVDRKAIAVPGTCQPGGKGDKETIRVIKKFTEEWNAGADPSAFKFKYECYSNDDIKKALHNLFYGKCAYCESRYAGTQPMDVEHWRPKGEVHLEDGTVIPGYYWLAAHWHNLLPSCIDCNRARKQYDAVLDQELTLGKANQFPLSNRHLTNRGKTDIPHNLDPNSIGGDEQPLLVNPCLDDPSDHFEFELDEAVVKPCRLSGGHSQKGLESIRVYALNRTELVLDRKETLRLIQQRIYCIDSLIGILETGEATQRIGDIVEELLSREIAALLDMQQANRAFAALARQVISGYARINGFI